MIEAHRGRKFELVHASESYPSPIGTTYEVRAVHPEGLMCRRDDGNPTFIPTNCMFPVTETETGFTINHPTEARVIAAYRWLDTD
jgi:hypothetical protein